MCGIIGIAKTRDDAVYELYDGLLMLQHRGQDSAGIVAFDGKKFYDRRGSGLVRDVFDEKDMRVLKGNMALGHCRYTTCGDCNEIDEAQPFFVNAPLGIYLIHNGNLTDIEALRKKVLTQYHRHLRTGSDTELLLNVFADQIYKVMKAAPKKKLSDVVFDATKLTMDRVTGAYSVITLIDQVGMLVFRDPHGIRPLVMGKKETSTGTEWAFASEDVAFKALGFVTVRDVKPGEAILVQKNGEILSHQCVKGTLNPCIFEYIYLARPDSMMNEISVYKTRLRMGAALAKQIKRAKLHIDSVMPVPDSGRPLAMQVSQELGIKYREGLVKNHYIGRTFIMPNQKMRQKSIRRKLNTIELEFKNRNILLIDDSIVRGNTSKQIIELCRQAGAKHVYLASGAPPIINPDVYGIDIPTRSELIAHGLTIEEIRKTIGADALFYQTVEDLVAAAKAGNPKIKKFHTGVFDGGYVTPEVTEDYLQQVEREGRGAKQRDSDLPLPLSGTL
ncbi:amidophosphoribosyltransferase [Candidatus Gracilibacteria bacterium]|nr:amidophosphoribosyltransferase [Candidatus Gracilibacteria bacterium]